MDTVRAGYDGGTFYLVLHYSRPTPEEIEIVKADTPLEIRFKVVDNIIYLMAKSDKINAVDAPFSPKYYEKPFEISPVSQNGGYPLLIMLTDSSVGRQYGTRLIGLGTKFSQQLYAAIAELLKAPFDMASYYISIQRTYNMYSTAELWNHCDGKYTVGTKDNLPMPAQEELSANATLDEVVRLHGKYVPENDCVCVFCVLECHKEKAKGQEWGFVVPIPVPYLREHGFTIENGTIYTNAPYDSKTGVQIDDKYYT